MLRKRGCEATEAKDGRSAKVERGVDTNERVFKSPYLGEGIVYFKEDEQVPSKYGATDRQREEEEKGEEVESGGFSSDTAAS